jgi:hypothetical protein
VPADEPGPRQAVSATASLLADRGEAALEAEFFRSAEFLGAEGATHTLLVEGSDGRSAIPLVVREIPGAGGALDATSPYGYPGGKVEGEPPYPEEVDWSGSGLVSAFVRERLGDPAALQGASERSRVLVSDPALARKSRMSDRQQIRKNDADGYRVSHLAGPQAGPEQRAALARVYAETMETVDAAPRYRFGAEYFGRLLDCPRSELFLTHGPGGEGDVAAAAIVGVSDGYAHYYLSGTADRHRRRAPSKNMIVAVTDWSEKRDLAMNLGGGMRPGDGLEEFKRGFANAERTFRTHEIVCDPGTYRRLSGPDPDPAGEFFPAYRRPRD